ncbi:MAG TPA: GrpB family protein, partial [Puia sp.]|nr:GrpB family protein [Puia sp.]
MSSPGYNIDTYPKWVTETVLIAAPDPAWPGKAAREIGDLSRLLAGIPVQAFEHIGSTSVPGVPAKPIIDIVAEVPDFDNPTMETIAQRLRPAGWHFTPPGLDARPYRRFFIKVVDDARAVHLQLLLPGSPQRTDQVRFRNLLRTSAQLRADYAALKRQLAAQHTQDREAYTHAKTSFVKNALST